MNYPKMLYYECASCGNHGLDENRPGKGKDECACGNADWKLMKYQASYQVGKEAWIHPEGEI